MLRARDRLRPDFADTPPDLELTNPQNSAWDVYCGGRLERLGIPVPIQRFRYDFRNRFGFTDDVDRIFDHCGRPTTSAGTTCPPSPECTSVPGTERTSGRSRTADTLAMARARPDGVDRVRDRTRSDRRTGNPGDPVIVLAHGWPESSHSWRHQIGHLVARRLASAVPGEPEVRTSSAPSRGVPQRPTRGRPRRAARRRRRRGPPRLRRARLGASLCVATYGASPTGQRRRGSSVPYTPWPMQPTEHVQRRRRPVLLILYSGGRAGRERTRRRHRSVAAHHHLGRRRVEMARRPPIQPTSRRSTAPACSTRGPVRSPCPTGCRTG